MLRNCKENSRQSAIHIHLHSSFDFKDQQLIAADLSATQGNTVCVGSSTCLQLVRGLRHIRTLEFKKPEPLVKKRASDPDREEPHFREKERKGQRGQGHEEAQPFTERGFVCSFILSTVPTGQCFSKPSSNKLSRRIVLEQKRLKCLPPLADLQVSIEDIRQESVTLKKGGHVKRRR